jgi:hypothetical protein
VGSTGMNATSSKLPRGGPGTDNPPYCPIVLSCGDVRDNIIAFGIGFIPVCSDFTQTAHSVYFTFAEINVTWCQLLFVLEPEIWRATGQFDGRYLTSHFFVQHRNPLGACVVVRDVLL